MPRPPAWPWRPVTSRCRAGFVAQFPERLTGEQRVADALAELAALVWRPEANIIKLPEHQRLDPAAEGRDRGAPVAGLRPARLPGRPAVRRGQGRPGPLRQGQGQAGQSGAPPGQLRPPCARVGEEPSAHPPALDGCLGLDVQDERRAHDRRRLPRQRAVRGHRGGRLAAHRAGWQRRLRQGAARVGPCARRRGRRRHRAAGRRTAGVPDRADRPRQGGRRPLLGAPEGDDDEGLRPDHLRARRACVPAGAVRPPRGRARDGRAEPQRRSRRASSRAPSRCPRPTRSGPPSSRASPTARRSRWWTPGVASPTCTCRAM